MSDIEVDAPLLFDVIDDHIALVRFNRPNARNAIDGATALALSAAVTRIEADPALRVAILASSIPAMFCAGADLKVVAAGRVPELRPNDSGFGGFVDAIRQKPRKARSAMEGPLGRMQAKSRTPASKPAASQVYGFGGTNGLSFHHL